MLICIMCLLTGTITKDSRDAYLSTVYIVDKSICCCFSLLNHTFLWSFCYCSQRIQMKQKVADAFISRFQLKPEEAQALKGSRDSPISEVSSAASANKTLNSHKDITEVELKITVGYQTMTKSQRQSKLINIRLYPFCG